MKAAKMKERPCFDLMRQNETQNAQYMQMPTWLFTNPAYADLSLDAKVTYTLLLNRFQLSRKNNWINERGEVFIIFPRKALAEELHVCEQRVTAAIKTLIDAELIWEKRCGRGFANQIYLARVCLEPTIPVLENQIQEEKSEICLGPEEVQNQQMQNDKFSDFRTSVSAAVEPRNLHPSKKDIIHQNPSYSYVSQSVYRSTRNDKDEERELAQIIAACELEFFSDDTANVFEDAIERLYYSEHIQTGYATIPKNLIRKKLLQLDNLVLRAVEHKLRSNINREIKNTTSYVMTVLFNCITECKSELLVDPYLNSI